MKVEQVEKFQSARGSPEPDTGVQQRLDKVVCAHVRGQRGVVQSVQSRSWRDERGCRQTQAMARGPRTRGLFHFTEEEFNRTPSRSRQQQCETEDGRQLPRQHTILPKLIAEIRGADLIVVELIIKSVVFVM